MLYVSDPCADMMRTCLCDNFDVCLLLNTDNKIIPKFERCTMGLLEVRDNTTEEDEYEPEYNVIRNGVYFKLKVWAVSEDEILMLCPEYVQFNKPLIGGLLNEDAERLEQSRIENEDDCDRADSTSEQSYYSENKENVRHLFFLQINFKYSTC